MLYKDYPGDPYQCAACLRCSTLRPTPQIETTLRRTVREHRCPQCRADVLVGYDNDVAALGAIADAQPVTYRDELLAVIAGLASYQLIGALLYRRDSQHLASAAVVVHLEHRCPPTTEDR